MCVSGQLERLEQQGLDRTNPANILGITTSSSLQGKVTKKKKRKKKKEEEQEGPTPSVREDPETRVSLNVGPNSEQLSERLCGEGSAVVIVNDKESTAHSSSGRVDLVAGGGVGSPAVAAQTNPATPKKNKTKKQRKEEKAVPLGGPGCLTTDPSTSERAVRTTKKKNKADERTAAVPTAITVEAGKAGRGAAITNEESLAAKLEQKLPILIAYFDVYVTSGRVEEAYEDFKYLR